MHNPGLSDSRHGYRKCTEYLEWLATDDITQKNARFHSMSRDLAIGSKAVKQETLEAFALGRLYAGRFRYVNRFLASGGERKAKYEQLIARIKE